MEEKIVDFSDLLSPEAKQKFEEVKLVEKKMGKLHEELAVLSSVRLSLQEQYRALCPPLVVMVETKLKCRECEKFISIKGLHVNSEITCPHCSAKFGIRVRADKPYFMLYRW
jgi:DNA-directed RNA polymerase subunit RPC12/RpoP